MTTETELSDERIAEILAGLEGVTPGPWQIGKLGTEDMPHVVDFGPPPKSPYMIVRPGTPAKPQMGYAGLSPSGVAHSDDNSSPANAAHIARCDPATIRAALTELQARRAREGEVGLIDGMSDEEFNRDRSAENPNVGKIASRSTRTEGEPVAVRELEWKQSLPTVQHAFAPFGMVYGVESAEGGWVLTKHEGSSKTKSFWGTEAEAKAAAQSHFETAIRSALYPAIQGEVTDEMVEAFYKRLYPYLRPFIDEQAKDEIRNALNAVLNRGDAE